MDPVREYIEQVAGGDVRAALAWLDGAGFRITKSQGGRGESFGNALLVFSGDVDVQILRDRGQWDIAVAPRRDGHWYSLAVLAAAQDGRDWEPCELDSSAALPDQLPPGIVWRQSLPVVLEWLKMPGSAAALEQTDARARQRLRRRFGVA
jgi:hypothetical protein